MIWLKRLVALFFVQLVYNRQNYSSYFDIGHPLLMFASGEILQNERGTRMADELRTRFTRARLAAIVGHKLREDGHCQASSHVAIVPKMGYLVAIDNGDSVTIRLVEELTEAA
jgi:hypothetical protein